MYPHFEYIIHNGTGIALIRKAAHSSIQATGGQAGPKNTTVPMIAFIRDPIERLQSGWRFFYARLQDFPQWHFERGRTYEDHVDLVLNGLKDCHWDSQAEILSGVDNLTCYRFEDLQKVWGEYGFPALPHNNKSDPVECNANYRVNDLKEFYKRDYQWRP